MVKKAKKAFLNKTSTSELVKSRSYDLILSMSIHGLPSIFRTKRAFFKLMWLLLTLLFTSACIYFSVNSILDYLQYDTITSITEMYEQESEFPTISICKGKSLPNSDFFPLNVIECTFNAIDCKTNYKNYFETFTDHFYGNCYRFNSGKNFFNQKTTILKSSVPGNKFGLNLELTLTTPTSFNNELVVHLHNKSTPAYELYYEEHFIGSGVYNYFPIEKTITKNLGPPYGNCANVDSFDLNRTIIEFIQKNGRSYTKRECYMLCGNLYYVESSNCGCGFGLDLDQIDSRCFFTLNLTLKACSQKFVESFLEVSNKCEKFCPVECETTTFKSNPYIRYVNNEHINKSETIQKKNFTSYDDFRLRFFSIIVYFRELKYTLNTQDPKTQFFDALSNFGGIMGVFIGTSFMSFFEFIELVLEIIITLIESSFNLY